MPTLKYSRQREAIKTFLDGRTDHPTADTVYTCLRQEYPNISLGTVYRNLSLLAEIGEIAKISTGSGAEHYDARLVPHQHFICTRCHNVYDIHINNQDALIAAASASCPGRIDSCQTNFFGICNHCLQSQTE
jgi:Fur family peroxide stress response transcriptional regulator